MRSEGAGTRESKRRIAVALVVVLTVTVAIRAWSYAKVFRPDKTLVRLVDPYRYLSRVDALSTRADGVFDVGAFVNPGRDDLMIAVLGWLTELLGGADAATVLAVYPPIVAVVTVLGAYLVGTSLTGSRWIGVLAAALLGITPTHVMRTAIGFGDHHAFDYLCLTVTFLLVLRLSRARSPRRWWVLVGLGVAIAAQTLAWIAGVLLVVPVVIATVLVSIAGLSRCESTGDILRPVIGALVVATVLTAAANVLLEWGDETFVGALAAGVVLLVGLLVVAELVRLTDRSYVRAAGVLGWALCVTTAGAITVDRWTALGTVVEEAVFYYQRTSARTIVETTPLFAGEDVSGVITGPVSVLGLLLLIAVPCLVLVSVISVRKRRPGWIFLASYGWTFLLLSALQRRFAGELSLFVAVAAAVGMAAIAQRFGVVRIEPSLLSLSRPPVGTVRTHIEADAPVRNVVAVSFVVTVVVMVTVLQLPGVVALGTIDQNQYETASWLEEYSENEDLSADEDYVFSAWDNNYLYNYYVSGESVTYGFAQRHYTEFVASSDPAEWYRMLRTNGTGFVVIEGSNPRFDPARRGDRTADSSGLSHYRALFRSEDGSTTVFRLVPGALVAGTAEPNVTVVARTDVSVPGVTFTYEREVRATESGWYGLLVPYPGDYRIDDRRVLVTEVDVRQGDPVGNRSAPAYWTFDEGRGRFVFDRVGNNHGTVRNAAWSEGVRGHALDLAGGEYARVTSTGALTGGDGLTTSVWFRTDSGRQYATDAPFTRLVSKSDTAVMTGTDGYQLGVVRGRVVGAVGDGSSATVLTNNENTSLTDNRWHRATLTWDGSVVRLYVDGRLREEGPFNGSVESDSPLWLGAATDGRLGFRGQIDEVRIYDRALQSEEIRERYRTVKNSSTG